MKSTQSLDEQLAEAKAELAQVPCHLRYVYTNSIGVHEMLEKERKRASARLQMHDGGGSHGSPVDPANAEGHIFREIKGDAFADLAALDCLMRALESDATYLEAMEAVGPLVERIHSLEDQIQKRDRRIATEEAQRREAKAAAKAKALAAVEAKFADPEDEEEPTAKATDSRAEKVSIG